MDTIECGHCWHQTASGEVKSYIYVNLICCHCGNEKTEGIEKKPPELKVHGEFYPNNIRFPNMSALLPEHLQSRTIGT